MLPLEAKLEIEDSMQLSDSEIISELSSLSTSKPEIPLDPDPLLFALPQETKVYESIVSIKKKVIILIIFFIATAPFSCI